MTAISNTEKLLVLAPDEIFVGEPAEQVIARVDESCPSQDLQAIQTGDRWLFFLAGYGLRLADGTPTEVIVRYGDRSKPLFEAQDDIETLRRLPYLTDSAIITGKVLRIGPTIDKLDPTPLRNYRIVAKAASTEREYTAITNVSGNYRFEVPTDSYEVTANTDRGFRESEDHFYRSSTHIADGACLEVDFTLLTNGKLAGRVTTAEGQPAKSVKVAIIRISPLGAPFTVNTDNRGHFEMTGRQPGKYMIGVGLLAPFASGEWKSRVYYPGVRRKQQAMLIDLAEGEWRTDINFKLLPDSKPQ